MDRSYGDGDQGIGKSLMMVKPVMDEEQPQSGRPRWGPVLVGGDAPQPQAWPVK